MSDLDRPSGWPLKGLGASFEARRLVLAAVGVLLLRAGWSGLDRLFGGPSVAPSLGVGLGPWGDLGAVPSALLTALGLLAEPLAALVGPLLVAFRGGVAASVAAHALLAAIWTLLVGGLVGVAICRVAALRVAGGEGAGMLSAARFAASRLVASSLTPMLVVLAAILLAIPGVLWGLLYRIPGRTGPILGGVGFVVPLAFGLLMAWVLASLTASWPLLVASVAAEGEDGFDALSRSTSYAIQRPGRYALMTLGAWGLGVVGLGVVALLRFVVVRLAVGPVSAGAGAGRLEAALGDGPHAFWLGVVGALAYAWIHSYFWTFATLAYLDLRREVDGTPAADVYLPAHDGDTFAGEVGPPK